MRVVEIIWIAEKGRKGSGGKVGNWNWSEWTRGKVGEEKVGRGGYGRSDSMCFVAMGNWDRLFKQ